MSPATEEPAPKDPLDGLFDDCTRAIVEEGEDGLLIAQFIRIVLRVTASRLASTGLRSHHLTAQDLQAHLASVGNRIIHAGWEGTEEGGGITS